MASAGSRGSGASERGGKERSKRKLRTSTRPNLLEMVPCRNRKWRAKAPGSDEVVIFIPRFKSRPGKAFGKLVKTSPMVRVNLDAYGSAVWRLCNGKATVEQIGEVLQEQFLGDVEPLYERLQVFLVHLENNELITYRDPQDGTKSKSIRTRKH